MSADKDPNLDYIAQPAQKRFLLNRKMRRKIARVQRSAGRGKRK